MPGYVVACVAWNNADAARRYGEMVRESLKPFHGRYLVRGSVEKIVEGSVPPSRLAILEFPSVQAAEDWYHSDVYKPALAIRIESALTH